MTRGTCTRKLVQTKGQILIQQKCRKWFPGSDFGHATLNSKNVNLLILVGMFGNFEDWAESNKADNILSNINS